MLGGIERGFKLYPDATFLNEEVLENFREVGWNICKISRQ